MGRITVPGVTREQIEQTKRVDILDYLQRHEPYNLVRQGVNRYVLRDHDSFVISNGKWCWNSKNYGRETATALNYLIDVRGLGFVDAVRALCDDVPLSHEPVKAVPVAEKAPIHLPPRNRNNDRVMAYLQGRGIDRKTIIACVEAGVLYESVTTHNCVFLGKDEHGKTRYGCMRGLSGSFRCDLENSDKRYGFVLPPESAANSHRLAIFESAIDALSHMSMKKQGFDTFDGFRLSTGGTTLMAVEAFFLRHPVREYLICTDNDDAGNRFAEKIAMFLNERGGVSIIRAPPPQGKDYNDTLLAFQRQMKEQDRTSRPRAEHSR